MDAIVSILTRATASSLFHVQKGGGEDKKEDTDSQQEGPGNRRNLRPVRKPGVRRKKEE